MLRVRVLGGVSATSDGRTLPQPGSGRAVALLGWLAVHPGRRSRAEASAALWPDVVDANARQSMRSALWSLRQVLPDEALVTTRDRVGLHDAVAVDICEFDAFVTAGDFAAALELSGGDLLAGIEDEWALIARDDHRARVGALLHRLADSADDRHEAVAFARRAVELDPWSEQASRLLMSCLADAGDSPAALTVYRQLGDRLRRALRVAPAEETWELAEVIRTRAAAGPTTRARSGVLPLVGRDRELGVLTAAWTAARTGSGGLAVVRGAPGIGKTRLVTQLVETAGGVTVATGATPELPGPPLGPWTDVCADLVRRMDPLPDAPWVAALAPLLPAHVPPDPVVVAPALGHARLAEAVVALVTEATRRGPVLIVLEDVHAADDASLAMLAHVVRRTAQGRTLVVVTCRPRPRRDRLDALEQAGRQNGLLRAEVTLDPLEASAVARLARLVGELDDAAVDAVVHRADGNPLLALEAARAVAGGDEMPMGLRGAARAAMARLPQPARELVRTLAVAGHDVELAAAADRAGVELAPALGAAEDEGLLECTGERVRFRHALLREAVYGDLPPAERVERHLSAAAALREQGDPTGAAAHLRAAGHVHDAGTLLLDAAAQARRVGAHARATELLEEARAVLPDDPAAAMELADVLAWRGRAEDARVAFATALPLIERHGDPAEIAGAHLRFAEWHYAPSCEPRVAVEACHRALAVMDGAGVELPELRCRILAIDAWCESIGGDLDEVDRILARLRDLVGDGPADAELDAAVARARCFALLRRGCFADAVAPGLRAGELARDLGRPDLAYSGYLNAAFALALSDDLRAALDVLELALAALRGHGLLALESRTLLARAWVLVRLGRFADAVEAAAQARRTADRLDAPDLQALVDAERGRIALRSGDLAASADLLGAALARPGPGIGRPLARLQRAEALARLGALDAAETELLATALEPVTAGDWPDTLVARASAVEGLIAAGRDDVELARRRFAEAAAARRRRLSQDELGQRMTDVMVDLGRPIIGAVVPAEELALVEADLARLPVSSEV